MTSSPGTTGIYQGAITSTLTPFTFRISNGNATAVYFALTYLPDPTKTTTQSLSGSVLLNANYSWGPAAFTAFMVSTLPLSAEDVSTFLATGQSTHGFIGYSWRVGQPLPQTPQQAPYSNGLVLSYGLGLTGIIPTLLFITGEELPSTTTTVLNPNALPPPRPPAPPSHLTSEAPEIALAALVLVSVVCAALIAAGIYVGATQKKENLNISS